MHDPAPTGRRRRVLVARLDNDGDVLLAGPAVRAVAASGCDVTLLCGPRGRRAAELLPGVARIAEYRAPWIDPDGVPVRRSEAERVIALAAGHDEAVVLTSFHQSALPLALLLRLAGVPRIAAISEDYPGTLLDVRHRVPEQLHEVERGLSLVATLGHRLPPGDDGALRVRRPGRRRSGLPVQPYVVVHPGASVPARAWAPERCAELVGLLRRAGAGVVVTGGPAERALTAAVAAGGPGAVDLGGRTSLGELADVLAGAAAVVCGNTGPAHLAAAVGTPVAQLYAPTVPAVKWAPWRVASVRLQRPVACAGCRARVCPVAGHPCIDEVTPTEVLAALAALAPGLGAPAPATGVSGA